ncbi:TPA: hypothetical protein ACH3X1_009466 [Trebouxia sp. C0004]
MSVHSTSKSCTKGSWRQECKSCPSVLARVLKVLFKGGDKAAREFSSPDSFLSYQGTQKIVLITPGSVLQAIVTSSAVGLACGLLLVLPLSYLPTTSLAPISIDPIEPNSTVGGWGHGPPLSYLPTPHPADVRRTKVRV